MAANKNWKEISEQYIKAGISVIPVKGKVPQIENWQRWCSELSEDPIVASGQTGIGVCLGQSSNLVAVDIDTDDPKVLAAVPPSPVARRGKKGEVRFYQYSKDIISRTYRQWAIEILSVGRQAVLPPSIHPDTGKPYSWKGPTLLDFDLQLLPQLDLKFLEQFGELQTEGKEGVGRHNKLKDIVVSMVCRYEPIETIAKEIYEYDRDFHVPPWFVDKNERWKAKEEADAQRCAFQFVAAVVSSLCKNKIFQPILGSDSTTNGEAIGHREFRDGFRLKSLKQLYNQPAPQYTELVEGMLPIPGSSIVAARPKVGKSTLARYCAHAIVSRKPFLGRKTLHGPVIYLCFEDREDEVTKHFKVMGTDEDAQIFVHAFPVPENAIQKLRLEVLKHKPVLVMVDTLFKLTKVSDGNDYALNVQALTPLTDMARILGFHIMFIHHSRKEEGTHGDGILGSTAVFGGIDTAIQLKLNDEKYTVHTIQRYGTSMPHSIIQLNEDRTMSVMESSEEASLNVIKKRILEVLEGAKVPLVENGLLSKVTGKTTLKSRALQDLRDSQKIYFTGGGTKGSPYLYSIRPPSKDPRDGREDMSTPSEPGAQHFKNCKGTGKRSKTIKNNGLGQIYEQEPT